MSGEVIHLDHYRTVRNTGTRLLTTKEFCAYFGIHRNTTLSWIKYGMPYIKLPGGNRFDLVRCLEWLETRQGTEEDGSPQTQ